MLSHLRTSNSILDLERMKSLHFHHIKSMLDEGHHFDSDSVWLHLIDPVTLDSTVQYDHDDHDN